VSDPVVALDPPYPIRLRGSFREVWEALRDDLPERRRLLLIADRRLLEKWPRALNGLGSGARRGFLAIPGGERAKSVATLRRIFAAAAHAGIDREDLLVALGGGTIGDIAGLAAATWMRGVRWCPVATTSLAMADSAVGGKTGLNLFGVKNLVGSFHQPAAVYGAMEALHSLPRRHLRAGLAEIAKIAIIRDGSTFSKLEALGTGLDDPEHPAWLELLRAATTVKADIVAADPRERGTRELLNFGHTIGHALEVAHRPALLHGEAVGLGMIAASWISENRDMAPKGTSSRVRSLVRGVGLPHVMRDLDEASFWNVMRYDKKGRAGTIRMVLTEGIGSASVGHPVSPAIVRRALGVLLRGA
jgi:3-dehydroquinate synthase